MTKMWTGIALALLVVAGSVKALVCMNARALPGLAWDVSLSGIEVESAEVEEYVSFEAFPVAVAA